MRFIIFFFVFVFISFNCLSQEMSVKYLNIKSLDTSNLNSNSFNLNRITPKGLTNKNPKRYFNYNLEFDFNKTNNKIDITRKTDLVTPTWKIRQSFNEGKGAKSKFRKDFYLGDIETNSKYIIIKCRDHEYVDGDKIRLMLNGSIIHPSITLTSMFFVVDVDLDD